MTIDTNTVKQNIDLRELAGRFTELRGGQAKELAGPCPKCGGDDRFHCKADYWFCRECYAPTNDLPHDAFAFVMWLNGCDFKEAAAILTNAPMPTPTTKRAPTPKRPSEQPEDWQRKAAAIVDNAHVRLFSDSDTQAGAGRAYLDSRGLEAHAWQAFKLGYTPAAPIPGSEGKQRAPAIVLPWYKGGAVRGVRYRFLQTHDGHKQTALAGSSFTGVLFGGQALDVGAISLSTLIVCEGEINAASIWQAAKDSRVDVLSLGSESATITPAMADYAGRYAHVIVWLDREERAQAVQGALPGAYGIKSPNSQDANDMLQAGTLGAFLALHRFQAARNRHEQERLLSNLRDAANVWPGADISTNEVMAHIVKVLGVGLQTHRKGSAVPANV